MLTAAATLIFATAHLTPIVDELADVDRTIQSLYSVISGEKGVERDWAKFKELFVPDGTLSVALVSQSGLKGFRTIKPDDYVKSMTAYTSRNGFFEREISRKVEIYGGIAHVWSTYETRAAQTDAKPTNRGVNSIQLLKVDSKWKVMSLTYMSESSRYPLPDKSLPGV